MFDGVNINALFSFSDDVLQGPVAFVNVGHCHAHYWFKFKVHGSGITGQGLCQCGAGGSAVQASGQNAIGDDICLLGLGAFIIIGRIAAARFAAVVDNRQQFRPDGFAQGPLGSHGFVPNHEVGFALVAEALMGKYPGGFGAEKDCIFPGDHGFGIPGKGNTFLNFS